MKNRLKRIIITTGALFCLTAAPIAQTNPLGSMTVQAATTYSDNWKIDGAGTWWYYLNDGSVAKDAWVKDYGEWYLLGSDGAMRTGVFQSNEGKYYLLDTVRNTGTYGKLLKNGVVYQGITLKCDTSEAYEGALSDESIAALKSAGVSFENVPNVENTKHVENGVITSNPTPPSPQPNKPSWEGKDIRDMTDQERMDAFFGGGGVGDGTGAKGHLYN